MAVKETKAQRAERLKLEKNPLGVLGRDPAVCRAKVCPRFPTHGSKLIFAGGVFTHREMALAQLGELAAKAAPCRISCCAFVCPMAL